MLTSVYITQFKVCSQEAASQLLLVYLYSVLPILHKMYRVVSELLGLRHPGHTHTHTHTHTMCS